MDQSEFKRTKLLLRTKLGQWMANQWGLGRLSLTDIVGDWRQYRKFSIVRVIQASGASKRLSIQVWKLWRGLGGKKDQEPSQATQSILRRAMPRRRGLFKTIPYCTQESKSKKLLGLPFCFSFLNIFIKIPKDLIANYQDSAVPCLKLQEPLGLTGKPTWMALPQDFKTWWMRLKLTLLTVFPNGSPGSATILLAVIYFLIFCTSSSDKSSVLAKHFTN